MLTLVLLLAVGNASAEVNTSPPRPDLARELSARVVRMGAQLMLHTGPRDPHVGRVRSRGDVLAPAIDELYGRAPAELVVDAVAHAVVWPALFASGAACGAGMGSVRSVMMPKRDSLDVIDAIGPAFFAASMNLIVGSAVRDL